MISCINSHSIHRQNYLYMGAGQSSSLSKLLYVHTVHSPVQVSHRTISLLNIVLFLYRTHYTGTPVGIKDAETTKFKFRSHNACTRTWCEHGATLTMTLPIQFCCNFSCDHCCFSGGRVPTSSLLTFQNNSRNLSH